MQGLTDGISSRFSISSRNMLRPGPLNNIRQTLDRTEALHDRLEELLVYEILKDGTTDYHRVSVRTLYKRVIKSITQGATVPGALAIHDPKSPFFQQRSFKTSASPTARASKSADTLIDQIPTLALGHAVVNSDIENPDSTDKKKDTITTKTFTNISSIDETDTKNNAGSANEKNNDATTQEKDTSSNVNNSGRRRRLQPDPAHFISTTNTNMLEDINNNEVTYRERLGGYLHPRDMRKLVTPFSASNSPELIVRRHAMLLNFDPLRAIILRDRLLVLVPDGADSILVELEKRVLRSEKDEAAHGGGEFYQTPVSKSTAAAGAPPRGPPPHGRNENSDTVIGKVTQALAAPFRKSTSDIPSDKDSAVPAENDYFNASDEDETTELDETADILAPFVETEWEEMEARDWIDLPFELLSLDAVLHCVTSVLADDIFDLQIKANNVINDVLSPDADIGEHSQEVLRTLKNSLKEMASRVSGYVMAINTTLEDYEDMALMNLSRLLTNPERFIQPVSQAVLEEESDEPELILEAHLQQGNTLNNALSLIQGQILTTEDFVMQKSDTVRNRLLYIDVLISLLSLCVGLASLVGSLFGMNVINSYEQDPDIFRKLAIGTCFGSFGLLLFMLIFIRKLGALPRLF